MRRAIFGLAFLIASLLPAFAQSGLAPAGTVWSNPTAARANAQFAAVTALLDQAFGCTNGQSLERGVSLWGCVTLGPGGSSGNVQTNNGSGGFAGITNTQLTALINPATATLPGAVPAWPNNANTFFNGTGNYTQVGNAGLVNPSTTVNGQTCTLGSTCTATAAAGTLTGTTLASNVLASSLTSVGTLSGLTVTTSFTATGLVTNGDLAHPSTTVNGQTCTLGSPCTVPAVTSVGCAGTTITTTGTCYSAGQVVGTATNDNATAGNFGETIQEISDQTTATVTISIASPAVITDSGTNLSAGSVIFFTTSGALPTGITANTPYYIIPAGLNVGTSYEISATPFGTAVTTTGTQSGTQTRNSGAPITTSSSTFYNIGTIQLTAGDWNCSSSSELNSTGLTTGFFSSLSTTSASHTGHLPITDVQYQFSLTAASYDYPNGAARISIASPTIYYLIGNATFSTGTAFGTGSILCRRSR